LSGIRTRYKIAGVVAFCLIVLLAIISIPKPQPATLTVAQTCKTPLALPIFFNITDAYANRQITTHNNSFAILQRGSNSQTVTYVETGDAENGIWMTMKSFVSGDGYLLNVQQGNRSIAQMFFRVPCSKTGSIYHTLHVWLVLPPKGPLAMVGIDPLGQVVKSGSTYNLTALSIDNSQITLNFIIINRDDNTGWSGTSIITSGNESALYTYQSPSSAMTDQRIYDVKLERFRTMQQGILIMQKANGCCVKPNSTVLSGPILYQWCNYVIYSDQTPLSLDRVHLPDGSLDATRVGTHGAYLPIDISGLKHGQSETFAFQVYYYLDFWYVQAYGEPNPEALLLGSFTITLAK